MSDNVEKRFKTDIYIYIFFFLTSYSVHKGCTNFTKTWELPQNSRRQKGDMKKVMYRGLTNISHHRSISSREDDLTPGILFTPAVHDMMEWSDLPLGVTI